MEKITRQEVAPQDPVNYRQVNWSSLERTPSRGLDDNVDVYPSVESLEADLREQQRWQAYADADSNNPKVSKT